MTSQQSCNSYLNNKDAWTLQLLWFSNGDCPRHDSYVENIIEEAHTNYDNN